MYLKIVIASVKYFITFCIALLFIIAVRLTEPVLNETLDTCDVTIRDESYGLSNNVTPSEGTVSEGIWFIHTHSNMT